MTFDDELGVDELSVDARSLLRRARSADEPQRSDITLVLHDFAERVSESRAPKKSSRPRKPLAFALAALALTASIGAFAKWGEYIVPSFVSDSPADEVVTPAAPTTELAAPRRKGTRREADEALPVAPSTAAEEETSAAPSVTFDLAMVGKAVPRAEKGASAAEHAVAPEASSERGQAVVPPRRSSGVQPAASAPDLSAELELISRARDALSAGRYGEAKSLTKRHAQAYPRGVLVHERTAIQALAQCREAGGNSLGRAFIQRWPDSPFAAVVLRDCALLNPVPEPPSGSAEVLDTNSVP